MELSVRSPMFDMGAGQRKLAKEGKRAREKKLQSMVKFDAVTFELFHMDSYEYEKYVAVMFAAKLFQATTQTNDDGLDEEIQTDTQELKNKWTQYPAKFSQLGFPTNLHTSRQDILGAGGDFIERDEQKCENLLGNAKNPVELGKFMSKAGKLMLSVMEFKKRTRVPDSSNNNNAVGNKSNNVEPKMILERGLSVMKTLKIHSVTTFGEFVACSNGHVDVTKKNTSKNLVTIWSLKEPSMPLYFLRVWGHVTILKMYLSTHLVVSGNRDGSLNFWHLKEPAQYHTQYQDQLIRTPSVNTSCLQGLNHTLPVMGLEIISESKSSALVVSVDKEKYLISWSCLFLQELDAQQQNLSLNQSAWSRLRVTVRQVVSLEEAFGTPFMTIYGFSVWKTDVTNFVVGTNAGFIGIGTLHAECPVYQKCYIGSNIIMNIRTVNRNQLVGLIAGSCEDEYCRLFDLRRKRAILSLECGGVGTPIKVLWSNIRHCLLYIGQEDRIEVWDLLASDLSPLKIIPMKDLTDFDIFNVADNEFIVVAAHNEMSVITVPLIIKPLEDKEKLRFKRYISII